MRSVRAAAAAIVLGLFSTLPAAASEEVTPGATVAVPKDATIRVHSRDRDVRITGSSRTEVRAQGGGALSVEMSEDHRRVTVSASSRGDDHGPIDVTVPAGSRVEVHTVSGDVTVTEVTGSVRAGSMSGAILVKGNPKDVDAETVSGEVVVDLAACNVRAATVSGSFRATCREKGASIFAKSVSAPLAAKAPSFERLEMKTVSGPVEADGRVAGDGPFELRSHSGPVTLTLPANAPVVIDARSRGKVDVPPPSAPPPPPKDGGAAVVPTVTLRSFSGSVRVARP